MAIAFVQAAQPTGTGSGATTLAKAFTSNNTAGNFLFVTANIHITAGTGTLTVSDSLGNTYTQAPNSPVTQSPEQSYVWYVPSCLSGANTVTVTATGTVAGYIQLGILEYSGVATSNPVDTYGSNSAGAGATITASTIGSTTNANDLVLLMMTSTNGGIGLPTGYTNRCGNDSYFKVDELITTSTGVQSISTSQNSSVWTAQIIAFLPPSSGRSRTSSRSLTSIRTLTTTRSLTSLRSLT